ncbi:MAG: hypothetical protein K0R41_3278 [Geminicoccaceae bacterium]|nr:hypothetical protein [Geminicoccaceae bacterium]
MTRHDFERWQRDPPQLQLSAIAAALREGAPAPEQHTQAVVALATQLEPDAAPSDREQLQPLGLEPPNASSSRPPSARAGTGRGARAAAEEDPWLVDGQGQVAEDALARLIDEHAAAQDDAGRPRDLDAALTLWPEDDARRPAARAIAPAIAPAGDPRSSSIVRLAAGARSGSGIYVRPDLVLTTAQMVEGASVVDVMTADLVQVARPGRPVMLHDGPPLAPGQPVEALALGADSGTNLSQGRYEGSSAPGVAGPGFTGLVSMHGPAAPVERLAMPWFAGDALIGLAGGAPFENPDGSIGVVGSSAIRDFLYGSGGALAALP